MRMNQTYVFDSFEQQQQDSEIQRLTKNIGNHSRALCEYFLSNGLLTSKKVLDVGCGTGAMLNMFAEILPETEFLGIDNSRDILESTKEITKSNISFVRGEAFRLPFEDNSFDFVYTRLVLMHNQNPENIVREMKRVCKPDGTIISVEIDDETMVFYPFAYELSKLTKAYIEYAGRNGTDRIMGRKLFSIYKSVGIDNVRVITQTSDYEGPYDDVPFSLRLALGSNEGRQLVDANLITEEQRLDYISKIQAFSEDRNRFYSGSFMYCVGKK